MNPLNPQSANWASSKALGLSTTAPPLAAPKADDAVLVVLAAGAVTMDYVSVINATSPAMLPYMGRPLISQIIVNHIKKHAADIVIALPDNESRLEEFLGVTFSDRVNLILKRIPTTGSGSPVASLLGALAEAAARGLGDRPAYIVHGDIYFEAVAAARRYKPTAFVADYVESDKYSYFLSRDGDHRYVESGFTVPSLREDPKSVVTDIGAYWVPSIDTVRLGATGIEIGGTVGAFLSRLYGGGLELERVGSWSDLGHLDTAMQIRTRLARSRDFNDLVIDQDRGLITKRSSVPNKLLREVNYYNQLPAQLSIYFPRVYQVSLEPDVSYTTEYYAYRTLAEYFVFFNFPSSVWLNIIKKLLTIHAEFREHRRQESSAEDLKGFYLGKLFSRMRELKAGTPIRSLVEADEIEINGGRYLGWAHYLSRIEAAIERLALASPTTIIHGDLCFSNILYDPQTALIRLIDPRGAFFEDGCYGDPRYDIAKLLHSFHGGYDFITQEMYDVRQHGDFAYALRLFRSDRSVAISQQLLDWVKGACGHDMNDLLVLEALLFLSMLPLHSDDADRQTALYLSGIRILREVYGENLPRS